MSNVYYVTRGGVVVCKMGPVEYREGKRKVPCVKAITGGWHGWLVLSRLRRATKEEVKHVRQIVKACRS